MRHVAVLATLAAALVVSGAAHAGGWATVGFTPLPDGIHAGETWTPRIEVLQHGRTPLSGLTPVVTVEEVGSAETASFAATETAQPGVYTTDVVFPSGGSWRVTVESGFWGEGGTLTYGPVAIEPRGVSPTPRSFPAPTVVGVLLLVLAAGALFAIVRTRRLTPASR